MPVVKTIWAGSFGCNRRRQRRLKIGSITDELRIEHGRDSVRQRPILHHRDRFCRASSASQKTSAIGFVLDARNGLGRGGEHVNPEHWRVFGRSRAAAGEQSLMRKIEFGFDEQITESRMRQVARWRRQHHFSI